MLTMELLEAPVMQVLDQDLLEELEETPTLTTMAAPPQLELGTVARIRHQAMQTQVTPVQRGQTAPRSRAREVREGREIFSSLTNNIVRAVHIQEEWRVARVMRGRGQV